jgi:hypothetical protein
MTDVGNGKECKVIIDGGSCQNLASKELCTKLKLKYYPHSKLYCISWLSDVAEMKITNTMCVEFSIGNYTDTVECNVVPMTFCHLLLGHPWQYDRDVHHKGKAKTHQLHWKGKDIVLRLMTLQAIVNESRQKTEFWLEQEEQRRKPSLAVYDPFSTSAVAHLTACFAATTVITRACTTSPAAPCMLTTAMETTPPATLATPIVPAALPLLGDADGPTHVATTMTDTGTYILMATKEDLREFGDDPMAIPLVLVYKGEIFVSNDNTPLSLGVSTVLQEFASIF